ncbi:MAG: hypothetical protein KGH78_03175 [Candidatus Micrarchaeota archaeon]|nr:hypothetical protein [Candidatus Micrarchaeota archaeon]MDE1846596.1 hypothetical protein [Candidatus Micrarchaeota archaeon]
MVGQENTNKRVERRAKRNGFLLLRPAVPANADKVARAIALCRGVRDVFVSSGEYAFVVETDQQEQTQSLVRRAVGQVRICATTNHYLYRRSRQQRAGFGIKGLPSK